MLSDASELSIARDLPRTLDWINLRAIPVTNPFKQTYTYKYDKKTTPDEAITPNLQSGTTWKSEGFNYFHQ